MRETLWKNPQAFAWKPCAEHRYDVISDIGTWEHVQQEVQAFFGKMLLFFNYVRPAYGPTVGTAGSGHVITAPVACGFQERFFGQQSFLNRAGSHAWTHSFTFIYYAAARTGLSESAHIT